MVDILHRIGVKGSSPDDVYAALTTLEGLSGWWARDTTGATEVGGVIAFRFVPGGFDMKVVELVPGKRVLWEVVEGPAEWVGTQVSFELSQAATSPSCSSSIAAGPSRSSSCTTAAPSGRRSCSASSSSWRPGGRARPDRRADQRLALTGEPRPPCDRARARGFDDGRGTRAGCG